ncbi:MAG TPA: alpha/beta hydrolase [Solirubrobacteraceae bacterium]|nr:alpha/beta hydrolase [Solirubrobacteraceae bacterium]
MPRPAPPQPPEISGVRRCRISARGVDFHVSEAGSLDGPVVFALHGWPQHHYEYRDLLADPPAGVRVIAPDLPGYGWSGPAPHAWAKEDVVSDLVALLDAMGIERLLLVGHDWGGWIGHLLALRIPERISAYLCLNIAHPWTTARRFLPHMWRSLTYMPAIAFAGIPVQTRTELVYRALRYQYVPRRTGVSDADLRWFSDRFHDPVCAAAGRDTYRTFLTRELPAIRHRPEERRSVVPTHCLFGAEDFAVHPDLAAERTANAEDYRLELIPGVGHFISDERPDLVRDRLMRLLVAHPPA